MQRYSDEIKGQAKSLFLQKWTPKEIATKLNLASSRIVYVWSEKGNWRDLLSEETVLECINRRIVLLTDKAKKTDTDLKEIDLLINHHVKLMAQKNKHLEKLAQSGSGQAAGGQAGFAAAGEDNDKPKKRSKKNDVSLMPAEGFEEFAELSLFEYQKHLRRNLGHDIRNILKSRQIGATWYFAFEALEDAVKTGKNQIFLSASKRQAQVFRSYIVNFAQEIFDVALTGEHIKLSNGATLYFLSTNKNTAQSHNGNLYVDEYFWIPKFHRLQEVASAMTTQDRFRTTYFSTPSAKTHEAYPFWTGDEWRKGDKKRNAAKFPDFDEMRDGGRLCPDGQWRYIITIEDACAGGLDALVTIDRLRNRYSRDTFNMLYMCVFVDSGDSVFHYGDLEKCGVDVSTWQDVDYGADRPIGNREVWAGFDPARSGDTSTFVIIVPPQAAGEPFRVIETWHWQGLNYKSQANNIKKIFARYNITFIGVDVTGIGQGIFERIQEFAQRVATAIRYSPDVKTRLVMKMIEVVEEHKIAWDIDKQDISASFLAIRKTVTNSGNNVTFVAERSAETGHADVFFATAHAMYNEPINNDVKGKSTWAFGEAA